MAPTPRIASIAKTASYLERCRRKRNELSYDSAGVVSDTEAAEILTEAHATYPRMLREIHDPPGVLFVRGSLKPADALSVGIVGTRHATHYGLRQAERLAAGLSSGPWIRERQYFREPRCW